MFSKVFNINYNRNLYILLLLVILFQLTALKYIWGINHLSRLINGSLFIILLYFSMKAVLTGKYHRRIWLLYIFPGIFISFGILFNIFLNSLDGRQAFSFLGEIMPWLVYLSVPYWMNKFHYPLKQLWYIFYVFMFLASLIGVCDYFLTFSGLNYLHHVMTSGGPFVSSLFCLYYQLQDGSLHGRLYSVFLEPGTFAMYLLPAMAYAFFYKRYFSLILFILAMFLTRSLGGLIGGILLLISLGLWQSGSKKKFVVVGMLLLLFLGWIGGAGNYLQRQYYHRVKSRTDRIFALEQGFSDLPKMIQIQPFGAKLYGSTAEQKENNEFYTGYTFTPMNNFRFGGVFALLGYCLVLFVSLGVLVSSRNRDSLSLEDRTVLSSIFPLFSFVIQRICLWDSAIFALLFAPVVLKLLINARQASRK